MCKPEIWVCAIKINYLTAAFVYLESRDHFFALTSRRRRSVWKKCFHSPLTGKIHCWHRQRITSRVYFRKGKHFSKSLTEIYCLIELTRLRLITCLSIPAWICRLFPGAVNLHSQNYLLRLQLQLCLRRAAVVNFSSQSLLIEWNLN